MGGDYMRGDCFICNKHAGAIETSGVAIYEDDYVYVGHIDKNGMPNYLGHVMIDLKRHAPTLGDMTEEEAKAFGVMMARVSKALMDSEGAEHVYSLVSGNSVPHLHMHLVARYPNTPEEYWGPMAVYDWENAPMGDNNDVIDLCNRLKDYLENQNGKC
jgi:histidine triad (HIT) family protein